MATPRISFVTCGTSASSSVTFSAGTVKKGDLILVWAGRFNSNIPPSLATGFTSVNSGGANTTAIRCGWKIATVDDDTVGTWTNSTQTTAAIYRNVHQTSPIGNSVMLNGNATSTSVTFSAFTANQFDKTSWVSIGIAYGSTGTNTAPSGMVARSSTAIVPCHDTNGTIDSFTPGSITIAAQAWRYILVEIVGLQRVNVCT
jgi:hypothetical protein